MKQLKPILILCMISCISMQAYAQNVKVEMESSLLVTEDTELQGNLLLKEDAELQGTLLLKQDAEMQGDLLLKRDMEVQGSVLLKKDAEIEGTLLVGMNNTPNPPAGTIRWNGTDFEGWNGLIWVSLSGNTTVGSVEDIQGNVYQTIRYGDVEWMTENLKVSRYNDDTVIPVASLTNDWTDATEGKWCWYGNNQSSNAVWGKLYNKYAIDTDKLCPAGWRVPSNEDYEDFANRFGGISKAGGAMKVPGMVIWPSPNTGATNESGFSALPGGFRDFNADFRLANSNGYFWTSSSSINGEYIVLILHNAEYLGIVDWGQPSTGASVRCMRDH